MRPASDPETLDRLFGALADQSRRAMIARLSSGPASVSELARPLGIALPSAVKHLAVLQESGVVHSEKKGRVRTYVMRTDAFSPLEAWVSERKRAWHRQLDALESLLDEEVP